MKKVFCAGSLLFFAFFLFFIFAKHVFASPTILGSETESISLTSDTVWTKENSPYLLLGTVTVLPQATLTISPGVIVKFDWWANLVVQGKLSAEGTVSEKIHFTSLNDSSLGGNTNVGAGTPTSNEFWGIRFLGSEGSSLSNFEVSYSNYGIDSKNSKLALKNFVIKNSANGINSSGSEIDIKDYFADSLDYEAIQAYDSSKILVASSTVQNTLFADGIGLYDSALEADNLHIRDLFSGNGIGIYDSSAHLKNVSISNLWSDALGVYDSILEMSESSVSDINYGFGVYSYGSKLAILNSSIENVFDYSNVVANRSTLSLKGSTIKNVDLPDPHSSALEIYSSTSTISGTDFSGGSQFGINVYGDNGSGYSKASRVAIASSTFRNFTEAGIYLWGTSTISVQGSKIENNYYGIESIDVPKGLVVSNNSFSGNEYAVFNAQYVPSPDWWLPPFFTPSEFPSDFQNNWWGDPSGPNESVGNPRGTGQKIFGAENYSPWLPVDPFAVPETVTCCSSVVFIPGLQASRLYKNGLLFENQLWEPNRNSDVEKLFLSRDGKSLDASIYTNEVIDEVNVSPVLQSNIYKSFLASMNELKVAGTIKNFKALPYDWRLDLNAVIDEGSKMRDGSVEYMISEIENLALSSKTGKVTIITHSNGGLVAKLLIQKLEALGRADLVDKLIMVAAPQLGTPTAIPAVLHGFDQQLAGGVIVNNSVARNLGRNMPGAYQLIPSAKYFEKVTTPVIEFDPSLDAITNFRQLYGNSISDSASLSDFLLAVRDHRIQPADADVTSPIILENGLLDKSKNIHNLIDSYVIPSNISVTQIAGWGLDTVVGTKYYAKTETVCTEQACLPKTIIDFEPIRVFDGDGTVVTPSATDLNTANTFYINLPGYNRGSGFDREHKDLLEVTEVLKLISNFFSDSQNRINFISNSKPPALDLEKKIRLSGHSPISIDLYDNLGNHTGLIKNTNINSDVRLLEEQIPNSSYMEFGEGKYVSFDKNATTTVKIKGTGIGTFTIKSEELLAGAVVSNSIYSDIPVFPTTEAQISFSSGKVTNLIVDIDGDGSTDFNLNSGQSFDPISYLQSIKNLVNGFDVSKGVRQSLLNKIDSTIKMLQKGKAKGVQNKIAGFLHSFKKDKIGHTKLNASDSQILVIMLNQLLNNLNK